MPFKIPQKWDTRIAGFIIATNLIAVATCILTDRPISAIINGLAAWATYKLHAIGQKL